jgi:hypothetical protein
VVGPRRRRQRRTCRSSAARTTKRGSGKALARLAGEHVELEAPRPHGSAAGRTVMTADLFYGDAQETFVELVRQNLQHGEGLNRGHRHRA